MQIYYGFHHVRYRISCICTMLHIEGSKTDPSTYPKRDGRGRKWKGEGSEEKVCIIIHAGILEQCH